MKIGLDLHGVVDRFPREFSILTRRWTKVYGHEVHIVTGEGWASAVEQVNRLVATYTHHFSIVDHHQVARTQMTLKDDGWWMPKESWDRSKGDYAKEVGLDIHFEDTLEYAPWFPPSCTFVHVGKNFGAALPIIGDFLNAWDLFRLKI